MTLTKLSAVSVQQLVAKEFQAMQPRQFVLSKLHFTNVFALHFGLITVSKSEADLYSSLYFQVRFKR